MGHHLTWDDRLQAEVAAGKTLYRIRRDYRQSRPAHTAFAAYLRRILQDGKSTPIL